MIERNKVYLGDCMDGMKDMPDNFIDLAIVDPPYGIGMDTRKVRTKPDRPSTYLDININQKLGIWDNDRPPVVYFHELYRISKNQIVWGANYFTKNIPEGRGWIYWDKQTGVDNNFSDGEFAYQSKGIQSRCISLSQKTGTRGGKDNIHPTQKPVDLYKWLLHNYAKEGDLILDTHVGSGSSIIACIDMGFDYIGYEIDEDYYKAMTDRIYHFTRQTKLEGLE